jgi:hypothetical protein
MPELSSDGARHSIADSRRSMCPVAERRAEAERQDVVARVETALIFRRWAKWFDETQ